MMTYLFIAVQRLSKVSKSNYDFFQADLFEFMFNSSTND